LVDKFFRSVGRHSQRAEEQIAPEDAINLDLPIVAYYLAAFATSANRVAKQ
jgi:hypothetical protein